VDSFDEDEAAPCQWMAAMVVVLASALVFLPSVISIFGRGTLPPAAAGLGFAGISLGCLKTVSLLYGVRRFSSPPRHLAGSFKPESVEAVADPITWVVSSGN
jgi:hypothetical protein